MSKKKTAGAPLSDFIQEKIDEKRQTKREAILEKRKAHRAPKEADRERSSVRKEEGHAPPQGKGKEEGSTKSAERTSVLNRPSGAFRSAPSIARLSEGRPKV